MHKIVTLMKYVIILCALMLSACSSIPRESSPCVPSIDNPRLVDVRNELPQWYLEILEESVRAIAFVSSDGIIEGTGTAWWIGGEVGWVSAFHIFSGKRQPVAAGYGLGIVLQGELTLMFVNDCGEQRGDRREDWITFRVPILPSPQYSLSYNPRLDIHPEETVYLVGRPKQGSWPEDEMTPEQLAFPFVIVKTKVSKEQPQDGDFAYLQCLDDAGALAGFSGGPAIIMRDGVPIVIGIITHSKGKLRRDKPVQCIQYALRKRFP